MLAKIWKKLCIFILIVACIFNIMIKLVRKLSFKEELQQSAMYLYEEYEEKENKTKQHLKKKQ